MAWYDVFDDDEYGDDDGWGLTYDTDWGEDTSDFYDYTASTFDDSYDEFAGFDDGGYIDVSSFTNDADYQPFYESPYDQANRFEDASLGDYYQTGGIGGVLDKYTGPGSTLGKYTGSGSFLGGLLGGKDGTIGGADLMSLVGAGASAWQQSKANDRYNEMMQPLTDLYKDQAADVRNRRANRDANIASEYDTWTGMMQPGWDRRDQIADNLRQAQGKTQSSSAAWDRAANEQFRDATKTQARQNIANAYDTRTGVLGGQLQGLKPWDKEYGQRQQNPYLNMGIRGMMGV